MGEVSVSHLKLRRKVRHNDELAEALANAARMSGKAYLKRMSVNLARQLELKLPTVAKFLCRRCGTELLEIHLDEDRFCLKCKREMNDV